MTISYSYFFLLSFTCSSLLYSSSLHLFFSIIKPGSKGLFVNLDAQILARNVHLPHRVTLTAQRVL